VLEAMASFCVNIFCLTGGEPLLRTVIVELVRLISVNNGIQLIRLTINRYLLALNLLQLIVAGLNRLNINLARMTISLI